MRVVYGVVCRGEHQILSQRFRSCPKATWASGGGKKNANLGSFSKATSPTTGALSTLEAFAYHNMLFSLLIWYSVFQKKKFFFPQSQDFSTFHKKTAKADPTKVHGT